jgi:hypothetical protein
MIKPQAAFPRAQSHTAAGAVQSGRSADIPVRSNVRDEVGARVLLEPQTS